VASLGRDFFARSVHEVAPELVGATLLVDGVGGTIVEAEAYAPDDPASHSFRGQTARNRAMFGPAGHAYVYRSYGIHWCLNLVCGEDGVGEAVLLRALEPTDGRREMRRRRGALPERLLCAGPGRLTEALGVTGAHDGLPLDEPPFELRGAAAHIDVAAAPRVGITRATEVPWRYVLRGSRFVSRGYSPTTTSTV
jgi:DNA-3-methyladenine glycosylase